MRDLLTVLIDGVDRDEGTIVVFTGTIVAGGASAPLYQHQRVRVAVDHRMAQPIADALADGDAPYVSAESWQITGGVR